MSNYFDYAASTPMSDAVLKAMKPWMVENFANPSASHLEGRKAADAIQKARETIADKIGAFPSEIIFTSGASEANNLALKGIAFSYIKTKGHIVTSAIEHKCILNVCAFLETLDFEVTYLKPDSDGVISPNDVKSAIKENTILISIHHVNNELGTIQSIEEIGFIAFENNIPFHTDAAQSFCKLDINVDDLNIDMLSLSAHKIYGPKGIGALYVRNARNANIVPIVHGGGQELGLRGGTLPTPLIVGLEAAIEYFPKKDLSEELLRVKQVLSKYKYTLNSKQKITNILSITFTTDADEKAFLAENSWLISQGSACNELSNKSSHVLEAIGLTIDDARRTYRISTTPFTLKYKNEIKNGTVTE